MKKRSPWFPGDVTPVRDGEYEVRSSLCRTWKCGGAHRETYTKKTGWGAAPLCVGEPGFRWRGLAEKP